MKAYIVFEDGTIFRGKAFGSSERSETSGEVVFNTSLSGYQEIITDPSYKGQIVCMTYPLIGNYGINDEDLESAGPQVEGLIVRELCDVPSNYRSKMSLEEYFKANGVLGISEVDTRAVTRLIRDKGAMKGIIITGEADPEQAKKKLKNTPGLEGADLVEKVSCREPFRWNQKGEFKVAVIDCGVKRNILRLLEDRGCVVTVFPATVSPEDIMSSEPQGILLSNGPGDPQGAPYVYGAVKELLGQVPIFGICLGHQMLALAIGGRTYKLRFGHHGGNQPVKDLRTGKVHITAQNHGFCVDIDSIKDKGVEITHLNLNDGTVEGIESRKLRFFSVQFHPEAGPGPNDAVYLFDDFIGRIKTGK